MEEQLVAARPSLKVELLNSNKFVGSVVGSPVEIAAGSSTGDAVFQPANDGQTVISVKQPPGFRTANQFASWTAIVEKPRLAVSSITIGKDLQVGGVLSLGAPAPEKGLSVTLVSDNPRQLLLSPAADQPGSASLTVQMKPGTASISYYLQALADSGTVTYSVTAPGFRNASGTVTLTPSGVLITPASNGPPDEAQVLRNEDTTYRFYAKLADGKKTPLAIWTVQLDPVSHRGADITVQPLRAGLTVTIPLTAKDPSIGRIQPSVTIKGGEQRALADFEPLSVGTTVVSVDTPRGFTPSANSSSVIGAVN